MCVCTSGTFWQTEKRFSGKCVCARTKLTTLSPDHIYNLSLRCIQDECSNIVSLLLIVLATLSTVSLAWHTHTRTHTFNYNFALKWLTFNGINHLSISNQSVSYTNRHSFSPQDVSENTRQKKNKDRLKTNVYTFFILPCSVAPLGTQSR